MIKDNALRGLVLMLIFLLVTMVLAANLGAMSLSVRALWQAPLSDLIWKIWLDIRLPRVLLAVVMGMALAVSGTVMQGVFRNPLADPGLLGISSGAGLAVALAIIIPLASSVSVGWRAAIFRGCCWSVLRLMRCAVRR